ncbi:MAG TPA: family 20 glycosylhydrolase [Fluviicola sp.]|nr:family 20 glycosylhydrolase [Fluviicola sp.]
MKCTKHFFLLAAVTLTGMAMAQQQSVIFPQPNEITANGQSYRLNNRIRYTATAEEKNAIAVMQPQFSLFHGLTFTEVPADSAQDLRFYYQPRLEKEHYQLEITKAGITIKYGDRGGLIYALQSLDQLMEEQFTEIELFGVQIVDSPRFAYRGVHLDCSRHFFTIDEIKTFLDQLAALKFNTFHWHLTDDQGWRLEIKQYPKLTEIGAWRDSTVIGHYNRSPREYEHKRYGGFYTQEEAKEIVRYAAERGITVMPEIELPGHARAALAAYPEMGCTGQQLPVEGLWGVFDDVFCTQPETIQFLKNILAEVIAVFPSETIHIGGDECPKTRWDVCPKCQKVRTEQGLHDSHELQSYVIREMEAFLNANGRKLMGWDEILEGGLADNAQVMSWRGTQGGIEAAKMHHPVVMTPGSHCYFDHYQSTSPNEPLAIGGYTPLEKVYAFNPVPEGLTPEEQTYILGAQANLWTEYLPDMNSVEYNAFPRLVAMSQVLWTVNRTDYRTFLPMMVIHYLPRLQQQKINHSTAFLDPTVKLVPIETGLTYSFENSLGSIWTNGKPTGEILLNRTSLPQFVKATVECDYRDEVNRQLEFSFFTHPLIGKPVHFITPPNKRYSHHDSLGLTDGVVGSSPWKGSDWLGFDNDTVQFSIDLGEVTAFNHVHIGFLEDQGSWIYYPKQLIVETSIDGIKFKRHIDNKSDGKAVVAREKKGKAKIVRITVINESKIPQGKPGAGNTPWTFIDEVMIY